MTKQLSLPKRALCYEKLMISSKVGEMPEILIPFPSWGLWFLVCKSTSVRNNLSNLKLIINSHFPTLSTQIAHRLRILELFITLCKSQQEGFYSFSLFDTYPSTTCKISSFLSLSSLFTNLISNVFSYEAYMTAFESYGAWVLFLLRHKSGDSIHTNHPKPPNPFTPWLKHS